MSALWPDTYVEEANLSFQISVLRKALGDDGARWMETGPKHGYRFSADVRASVAVGQVVGRASAAQTSEPSSVMLKRSNRKAWLVGATIAVALLVVAVFLKVGTRAGHGGGQRLRPPSPFRSRRIRDTSVRRASRTTEAGSPFPGTARRRTTTTSTSKWPGPGNLCV